MKEAEKGSNMKGDLYITVKPIGYIESPYKEKFAVPRQPGLVPSSRGYIHFYKPYDNSQSFTGLDQFSHIWVEFYFNECEEHDFMPMIRPPRLGGNQKTGVFATRSPFRPNRIGLSVISLIAVHNNNGHTVLEVSGFDLVNNTPILDIKPYIPYADSIPNAIGGFAHESPELMKVRFSDNAQTDLSFCASPDTLRQFISEVLSLDPRPAHHDAHHDNMRVYGAKLYDYNVTWRVEDHTVIVEGVKTLSAD